MSEPSPPRVNSQAYWSGRFEHDWEQVQGPRQTRFFSELAVAAWPAWLRASLTRDRLTLCDWGCALGDGVDVLGQAFGSPVCGVDFSAPAIDRARQRFAQYEFSVEDWLTDTSTSRFDVVFSSNTLEHFAQPWQVLSRLAEHARHHVVLLLPYQEHPRSAEHEYSFDAANIPVAPTEGWCLAQSTVIDCGQSPYWAGQQILLVYSRQTSLQVLQLTAADLQARGPAPESALVDTTALRCEIAELRAQVALLQRAPAPTGPTLSMARPIRSAWLRRVIDKFRSS